MKMIVKSGQISHDGKIYYTGETLEIAEDAAELLVARGLAESQEGEEPEKSLEEMTVKELTVYAAEQGISLPADLRKKADLIATIRGTESGQFGEQGTDGGSSAELGDGPDTSLPE